jgi:tetratricopeptide (TPR) repeat protein
MTELPEQNVKIGEATRSRTERWQQAIWFKTDGRYDEALIELKDLLVEFPDDSEIHHQVGLILGFTGDFDQSLIELVKAADQAPDNTVILNDLALTYTMLGMYDEAKAQFARVLERDRENQIALRNLTYFG